MRSLMIVSVACVLASGCYPDPRVPPKWVEEMRTEMKCGMTLQEVRTLTDKEITHLEGAHWFLGSYHVSTAWHDVWLHFDDSGLRKFTWGAAEDSKYSRLSPRYDLCTEEVDFLLEVVWTEEYVGSDIFLDDELVAEGARVAPPLEISAGLHELRVEPRHGPPVVREIHLTTADRGDQTLRLSGADRR